MAIVAWLTMSLPAAVVTISGSLQINGTSVPTISLGDRFNYQLQLQDATVDTEASDKQGLFLGALLSVTLSRADTNTGSWNPAGGTFLIGNATVETVETPSALAVTVGGAGFPPSGNGYAFEALIINFNGGLTVNDTGSGQTLAQQLGGAFPVGSLTGNADLRFRNGSNGILTSGPTSATVIPEPGGITLILCGTLIFYHTRRRATYLGQLPKDRNA